MSKSGATAPVMPDAARAAVRMENEQLLPELRALLERAGCFKHTPGIVAVKLTVVAVANLAGYALLLAEASWPLRVLALLLLAIAHAQGGFLAHDAVHGTLVRNQRISELLGQVLLSFATGLSYSYFFKFNHRRHHAYCGIGPSDPEMQSNLLALYKASARDKVGLSRHTSRRQAWLLWILLTLNTFSLRASGLAYVRINRRATTADQVGIALHAMIWLAIPIYCIGAWDALLNYLALTWLVGIYLAGIFPFYHVGCKAFCAGEEISFLRQQIEATRNMSSSWFAEIYTGGTNNHVEHHLFPGMPTAQLRRARTIIREFCARHQIAYCETGYRAAFGDIWRHLSKLARYVPGAPSP